MISATPKRFESRKILDNPSMDLFLGQIVQPTEEENRELVRRTQAGDIAARNECVERNLRLVVRTVAKHKLLGTDWLDAFQVATEGLMRAVELFDLNQTYIDGDGRVQPVRFSTYAANVVRRRLQRETNEHGPLIHTPVYLQNFILRMKRAGQNSAEIEESHKFASAAMRIKVHSYDADNGRSGHAAESMPTPEVDPLEGLERSDDRAMLGVLMRVALDDREQQVLAFRYGLDGGEPLTLQEISDRFGLSREWVRQVESRGIAKLKKAAAKLTNTHKELSK